MSINVNSFYLLIYISSIQDIPLVICLLFINCDVYSRDASILYSGCFRVSFEKKNTLIDMSQDVIQLLML